MHSIEPDLDKLLEAFLQIERASLERLLAGGFAHQMRNALVRAQLFTHGLLPQARGGDNPLLALDDVARELRILGAQTTDVAVLGVTQRANDTILEQTVSIKASLGHIDAALQRALAVIAKVDEYANVAQPRSRVAFLHASDTLTTLVSQLRGEWGSSAPEVELATDADVVVPISSVHFVALCRNLLQNARDAVLANHPAGGGRIVVRLRVQAGSLLLGVQDNGAGIAADDLPHIYEPFFTTAPSNRVGLGLCLVRRIAELYDGQTQCSSVHGKGAEFVVTLSSQGGHVLGQQLASAQSDLVFYSEDTNHCIVAWQSLLILIWRGKNTLEGLPGILPLIVADLKSRYEDHASILVIHEAQADLPKRRAQQQTTVLERRYRSYFKYGALVIASPGFIATTARVLASAMAYAARMQDGRRYFVSVADACHWISRSLARDNRQFDLTACLSIVESVRSVPVA